MSKGYDLLLEHIGRYGPYQKRMLLYMYLTPVIVLISRIAWVFLGATPAHRCLLPFEDLEVNYTLPSSVLNRSIPWDPQTKQWSQCLMFNDTDNGLVPVKCDHYVYDTSVYTSSAVTEWNLVCDRAWMRATAQSVIEAGVFCGATILGILSDKVGRKTALCLAVLVQIVAGGLAGIVPEFYSFIVLRFFVGCASASLATAFILGVELVGPKDRIIPGVVFNYFFSVGYFVLGLYAYFITEWRSLNAAVSLTGLILVPYWWVLPESNRWLIVEGKFQQVKRNVINTAKTNRKHVDVEWVDKILRETQKSEAAGKERKRNDTKIGDILRHRQLRNMTLILSFIWFVNNAVYWGVSFNVSNLGGNLLLNFVISGLAEFPGNTSLFILDKYVGRRASLSGLLLLTGLMLVATSVVPEEMSWLIITFAMVGKMAIAAAYALVYINTTELYPTVVRNAGMGVASTCARIGGMIAPYILLLPLPMIVYGCLSFLGGILGLLLPETKGKPLPETLEDLDLKTRPCEELETGKELLAS